jgi:nucleoside-diphosphate-sugar epimerase
MTSETNTQPTVLVTGANSFYAGAIIDLLVARNFHINGTVRSASSIPPLQALHDSSFTPFLVPDITVPHVFDAAAQNCIAIFHVASPVPSSFQSAEQEVLLPAINGVTSIMDTASRTPTIKRIILTSSVAAIITPSIEKTYTEEDWYTPDYAQACKATRFQEAYIASKALAEKAAWDFIANHKPHFDLVTINPSRTYGGFTHPVSSASALPVTLTTLARLVDGHELDTGVPTCLMPWVVHIRDVAEAHVQALVNPAARGRYIITAGRLDNQGVVDVMHEVFGDADWIANVPRGQPGETQRVPAWAFDAGKSRRELGLRYAAVRDCVVDFCRCYAVKRKEWASEDGAGHAGDA